MPPKAAAAYLGISVPTLYRRVKDGLIHVPSYAGGRTPRWRQSWLDQSTDAACKQPATARAERHAARLATADTPPT
jgi:predicted DNA-binding transcriptional regulator AlpA